MGNSTIDRLRREEEAALARVISIQRKLAQGSTSVTLAMLREGKAKLDVIQEELILAGVVPGLFLSRYFYLIDRAEVQRSVSGTRIVFPTVPAIADFRDGPLDERFLFDVERSLEAAASSSDMARLKTMQTSEERS